MKKSQYTAEQIAFALRQAESYYGFIKDGKTVIISFNGVLKQNVDKYSAWRNLCYSLRVY